MVTMTSRKNHFFMKSLVTSYVVSLFYPDLVPRILSLSELENPGNEFTFTSCKVSANDLDLVPKRIGHSNLLSSECMNAVCLIN